MERYINILIIDKNLENIKFYKKYLLRNGNNLIFSTIFEASEIIKKREIGLLILNNEYNNCDNFQVISETSKNSKHKNFGILILTHSNDEIHHYKTLKIENPIDFYHFPLEHQSFNSKVELFKSIFFKDIRLSQLLENIFPLNVLQDLNSHGKFSPRRIENGVVLFTDFVGFSQKTIELSPIKIIKQLEKYFVRFDEICNKYKIEKIKTIGDSYMAVAGVTENYPNPELRICLAALEMRNFVDIEKKVAKTFNKEIWEMRIGINNGPLISAVIGKTKFNFDIWGDTVNIASRAEQAAEIGKILITNSVFEKINPFLETEYFNNVLIKKRGGLIPMFNLEKIKPEFRLNDDGVSPNKFLLEECNIRSVDFRMMKMRIFNQMRSLLPKELSYHNLQHILDVEKSAKRYIHLEGLSDYEATLLLTAIYYHDSGYMVKFKKNEDVATKLLEIQLPNFGYSEKEIQTIIAIINTTKKNTPPNNLMEKIMCDANLDYLGRADYYSISYKLKDEFAAFGLNYNEKEWLEFQLDFLQNKHQYYTESANNLRLKGKMKRISEIKEKLKSLD